eukprot:1410310-Rhodomonas_salina.2
MAIIPANCKHMMSRCTTLLTPCLATKGPGSNPRTASAPSASSHACLLLRKHALTRRLVGIASAGLNSLPSSSALKSRNSFFKSNSSPTARSPTSVTLTPASSSPASLLSCISSPLLAFFLRSSDCPSSTSHSAYPRQAGVSTRTRSIVHVRGYTPPAMVASSSSSPPSLSKFRLPASTIPPPPDRVSTARIGPRAAPQPSFEAPCMPAPLHTSGGQGHRGGLQHGRAADGRKHENSGGIQWTSNQQFKPVSFGRSRVLLSPGRAAARRGRGWLYPLTAVAAGSRRKEEETRQT